MKFVHPTFRKERACNLGRACEGCTFGDEPHKLSAIVFDLDDTLIDTFSMLIEPLEKRAAKAMFQESDSQITEEKLAALLLEARKKDPSTVDDRVRAMIAGVTPDMFSARRRVLTDVPLDNLRIDPSVLTLLQDLYHFKLYLVTEGDWDFQNAKIEKLRLRGRIFQDIAIVESEKEEDKEQKIAALLEKVGINPNDALIVGNRLDKEILAGENLGAPTVWVQHGEGSKANLEDGRREPDYTIDSILKLRDVLLDI